MRSRQTNFPLRSRALLSLIATSLSALLQGCAADIEVEDEFDVATVQSEIIGGVTITPATRRSMGLLDVGGCSGVILTRDWILTAGHCVDWATPSNNVVKAVRADGGLDQRTGVSAVQAGLWDIAMVKLSSAPATWPTVTYTIPSTAPNTHVNGIMDCYGKGASGYAQPQGVTFDGLWRRLSRTIGWYDSARNFFMFNAIGTPGREVVAWGDSGGGCFHNGVLIGTVKGGDFTANNPADPQGTTTNITTGQIAALQPQKSYLDEARNRANATFVPLTTKNGWIPSQHGTNYAGYSVVGGTVFLRGALKNPSSTASPFLFTLPPAARPVGGYVYVPITLNGVTKGRLFIETNGDVRVQAETAFSNATNFTSLDGVSFERLQTGHTPLPLQPGWVKYGGSRVPGIADYGTVIRLVGAISGGTSQFPFTIPAGFRPSTRVYVSVDLCSAKKGRLVIEPSGSVTLYAEGAFSDATCFTSLDGVSYAKDSGGFALSPLNGWATSPYSTRAAAVRNNSGIITFQGALSSTGNSGQLFYLPPAYAPATKVYVQTDLCSATKGRIVIHPTGEVQVEASGTFSNATCFTSLEGVTFGI
ncbi:MAG TPA: trypsin-like serine protease [Polyangiaceae bacterium]|nr:trypsin-like serine protease [Polyangiaceae bacterium]